MYSTPVAAPWGNRCSAAPDDILQAASSTHRPSSRTRGKASPSSHFGRRENPHRSDGQPMWRPRVPYQAYMCDRDALRRHLQDGSTGAIPLDCAPQRRLLSLLCSFFAALAIVPAYADTLSAVQVLRAGGCGGVLPAAQPVHHNRLLDRAAEQWAAGLPAEVAAKRSGYEVQTASGVHISGPEASTIQLLRRSACRTVTSQGLQDIGVYHRGLDTWLVMASAYAVPTRSRAPASAEEALRLVNEVRARGTRCGQRSFGPAPPMRLSGTLAGVALGHASDMAEHNYFEHVDQAGRSPADRVRAVGYREKLVGENIAYGPQSVEEVVQGWLDSPGHCENIMDPRFAEMGLGYAAGQAARRGLFWVQLLAAPRV